MVLPVLRQLLKQIAARPVGFARTDLSARGRKHSLHDAAWYCGRRGISNQIAAVADPQNSLSSIEPILLTGMV
jgi:hypothetical protein